MVSCVLGKYFTTELHSQPSHFNFRNPYSCSSIVQEFYSLPQLTSWFSFFFSIWYVYEWVCVCAQVWGFDIYPPWCFLYFLIYICCFSLMLKIFFQRVIMFCFLFLLLNHANIIPFNIISQSLDVLFYF